MKLGIVGLGYVGLPLALAFAEAGNDVVGLDTDAAKLSDLAAGHSYIEDVDDDALAALASRLHPTSDYANLEDCKAVIVCVPTPLSSSREPDLSYLREAAAQVAAHLQPGQLIVLESTSYPGTTREELLPALAAGGRTVGEDFFLAFSPERIDPGRSDHSIRTTPEAGRRHHPSLHRACPRPLRADLRHGGAPKLTGDRRAGEAPREHLPLGQHRPGQRNRPAL
jgi:UDP-N-acetyl-D-glucosamine dehydrogenase